MIPLKCIVIRDGEEMEIPVEDLVRGDVVKFGTGDKVPADIRVILSRQAKVECSSITGLALITFNFLLNLDKSQICLFVIFFFSVDLMNICGEIYSF